MEVCVNGRLLGTIAAVVIVVAAAYAMRRAGNALRDQLKGGRK
jgi:hypothetical protein